MVIEIVDGEEKIRAFLPVLDEMLDGGMATLQPVQVLHYRHGKNQEAPPRNPLA